VIADLDTLLTALYVELAGGIIPVRGFTRCGPGGRPEVTGAGLACIAVAQVLLRFDDERRWLRVAPRLVGHLFPRLRRQSEYRTRRRQLAPLMQAAVRWLADAAPASAGQLRLMDATPGGRPRLRGLTAPIVLAPDSCVSPFSGRRCSKQHWPTRHSDSFCDRDGTAARGKDPSFSAAIGRIPAGQKTAPG
jgi:hypothetical protein